MGGLVIADTLLSLLNSPTPASTPVSVLGLIAFDTPYWGLNPGVFKNTLEKVLGYAQTGQAVLTGLGVTAGLWGAAFGGGAAAEAEKDKGKNGPAVPTASPPAGVAEEKRKPYASTSSAVAPPSISATASSSSSSWFKVAGAAAVLAAAGAGAAYYGKDAMTYSRDTVTGHWTWAKSHLDFVGELWSTDGLEKRLEAVEGATRKGYGFHWYVPLFFLLPSPSFLQALGGSVAPSPPPKLHR